MGRFSRFSTLKLNALIWLLALGLFLQSCLPEQDSSSSTEASQKLSKLELAIDAQGNVTHKEKSIGTLTDSETLTDFLLGNYNYDTPSRQVVLNVEPSTPYSLVKKTLGRCIAANLRDIVFVGSELIVSLPPKYHAETLVDIHAPQNIEIEILSDGQVIAGKPPWGDIEESDKLKIYLLGHGQVHLADPNPLTFVVLRPEDSAHHKHTLKVLNTLVSVNEKLDSFQANRPQNERKLFDRVYIDATPYPFIATEEEEIEVKVKKTQIEEGQIDPSELIK